MPSPESVRQTLTWVLLPNGLTPDRQRLQLSVFMTPSLTADDVGGAPMLSDFVDFVDWPARLRDATFKVAMGDGREIDATADVGVASSELWKQLLPGDTPVQPFAGNDLTSHPVMTYSEPAVAESLQQSYADTTILAIDDLPVLGGWEGEGFVEPQPDLPFADLVNVFRNPNNAFLRPDTEETFVDRFGELLTVSNQNLDVRAGIDEMVELMPTTGQPGDELARALTFNRGAVTTARAPEPDPAEVQTLTGSFDFHKIVAALGEHTALLRGLGLVFDLTIPLSTLTDAGAVAESGHVRLLANWHSQLMDGVIGALGPDGSPLPFPTVDNVPATEFRFDPASAMPFQAESRGGNPPGFLHLGVGRFHVEQMDVDGSLQKAAAMVLSIEAEQTQAAPPAMRTAGLTLVEDGRASQTYSELAASAGQLAGADPSVHLFAEDLTRGYRLDIFDEERDRWFSLHARRVSHERNGTPFMDPADGEGMFHVAVTGAPAAPGAEIPPGTPLYMHESFVRWDGWSLSAPRPGRPLSVHPNASDVPATEDALTSTGLRIEARVTPGTLPRLRFGRTYRMRVRTVDLAGNGPDLAMADRLMTDRPEPEGAEEGVDRWDTEPAMFGRFEPVPPPVFLKQRTGSPGEAQHRLVVRSGFDPDLAPQLGGDPDRDERILVAPKGSVEMAERHGGLDDAIGSSDREAHARTYDVAAQESGIVPDGPVTDIPYLPDPLSAGIAVVGLPGMPVNDVFYARWDADTWDNPKPITFRLLAHTELFDPGPQWDPATRTVTVFLAAARQLTVRVSSMLPPPPAKPPLGMLEWCRQRLDPDAYRQLEATVLASRHCMFTPWQDVELIHAVQRPRQPPDLEADPDLGGLEPRGPGETDYRFTGSTVVDHHSTGSVDLAARWKEWNDDPNVPMQGVAGVVKDMSAEIGTVPVPRPVADDELAPRVRFYSEGSTLAPLQFSDTKHRRVTFHARAITRFAELFPRDLPSQPGRLSVDGETLECILPSTERPPVPAILDVVPTSVSVVDPSNPDVRRREGGWLRIYVARPWYVTGEGEQLAVVVPSRTPRLSTDPHYDYSSLLGADPARFVSPPTGFLTQHLEGSTAALTNVTIPEAVERNPHGDIPDFTILAYDPKFDETNQRWYFDVRVNVPDSYFPMVRLAVVRYQRVSIDADPELFTSGTYHHFSPVVPLEPVPLLPDRELLVQEGALGDLTVQLKGTTYQHVLGFAGAEHFPDDRPEALAQVTVSLQERRGLPVTGDPDDDWVTVVTFPMPRDEQTGIWRTDLSVDLQTALPPGTQRLLVVEEDRLPTDPAGGLQPGATNRLVYAEAVDLAHRLF